MKITERIIPAAFLVCVGLTACNGDHPGRDGYSSSGPAGPVETVAQPNMPAPQPAAPEGPASKDSATTRPLDTLSKSKENTTMPEALHGNNHSSPALKKSSLLLPKAPKVIWI
jgi:hypothetical protein